MLSKAELAPYLRRAGRLAAGIGLASALLTGCSLAPAPPGVPAAVPKAGPSPLAATSPTRATGSAALPRPAASTPSNGQPPAAAGDAVVRALAYADRVRNMSQAELSQEVARLGIAFAPADQMQLALVLSQMRQTPELIRAQELLTRLLANMDADAQALHPLARLLAARLGEQRRLEDQLEKQNQQTREVQRRLDQTNERLEALKAIERSLTSRSPAPAASAPASRPRPSTAP